MRRRAFIAGIGASALPLVARAQPAAMPVIGFLNSGEREAFADRLVGFHRGLGEAGFFEKQNVAIEYRWAGGQLSRLPGLAAELVRLQVKVIAATGNLPSAIAAKDATSTIPIVFISGPDPVKAGLVKSLNRPGGNATGVSTANNVLGAKRLQILRDLLPGATRVAALVNPTAQMAEEEVLELQKIASSVGLEIVAFRASAAAELEAAFATLVQQKIGALIIPADPFFNSERDRIIRLAARHRVPTIYNDRIFASAGGLLAYGPSLPESYRQAGTYTGLILKGSNPADLPVVQPTKFELVLNQRTAKALGLIIPDKLVALADEVIE
jgi:putative ABC transport system substrate-binding protein